MGFPWITLRLSIWRAPLAAAVAIAWTFSVTSGAAAVTPAVLLADDLVARPITVQSLRDGDLSYFDDQRRLRVEPLRQFLRMRIVPPASATTAATSPSPAAPAPASDVEPAQPLSPLGLLRILRGDAPPAKRTAAAAAPLGVLELIDGQRLVGRLVQLPAGAGAGAGAGGAGQSVHWRHAMVGDVVVSLDAVRMIALEPAVQVAGTPAADRLVLVNGDALQGFVVAIRAAGIEFQPAGQTQALNLSADRVRMLHLANPLKAPAAGGHVLWLVDGSRIRVGQLAIAEDVVTASAKIGSTAATLTVPLAQVSRIDIDSTAGRLVDLADLAGKVTAGGQVFGLPMPPRTTGRAIELHAPLTIDYPLPAGAQRFSAQVDLAAVTGAQRPYLSWADIDVIVAVDGKPAGRFHLDADKPRAAINLPAQGSVLSIQLDPAANGPIMDRAILRDATILVRAAKN